MKWVNALKENYTRELPHEPIKIQIDDSLVTENSTKMNKINEESASRKMTLTSSKIMKFQQLEQIDEI